MIVARSTRRAASVRERLQRVIVFCSSSVKERSRIAMGGTSCFGLVPLSYHRLGECTIKRYPRSKNVNPIL